jgi:hypothetical protein
MAKNISNGRKIPRPKGHKICQDFPLQDPPKFTPIGIFGWKTNHLATLVSVANVDHFNENAAGSRNWEAAKQTKT